MDGIYVANSTASSVAAGAIPLGSTIHYKGCSCVLNGDSILLQGSGIYKVDVSITATGTNLSFQLYQDGVAVTGAVATETGETSTTFNLGFTALVRNKCCCSSSNIVIQNIGATATVDNIAVVVTKL